MLFLVECKIPVRASIDVIHVPTNYSTIQEAINYANPGDTIFVHTGTYYEHVVVNKSVSLVGEHRDFTIVDGNKNGSVIFIAANNVSIGGFTIRRSGTRPYDCGIFIEHSDGNDISHNTMTSNLDGISLYYSSNNMISDNIISSNNYHGISLYSSSNNLVLGNTIANNRDGIGFYSSSNNLVLGNTIANNRDGISLYYSSDNLVSGNTIANNMDGMYFALYSSDNLVSGNTIANNMDGMYFALYSSNNTVYLNNFNNTRQARSDSTNVWDDGVEGNYWSDYAGQDPNTDGIGDNPYIIDANNNDTHPLMGMFSIFEVSLKEKTYRVTTICNSTISDFRFEIGPETGNKVISFNVTDDDSTVGFCRVVIPTGLMSYPYIVLVDAEEIVPTLLGVSNETHAYLYFTYAHDSHSVRLISSKTLHLYNELLDKYVRLQIDLYNLNATYYDLLNRYSVLLGNFSQLQANYSDLNNLYQRHLLDYSEKVSNLQNLMYIFAATTAIFLITTIYLSKRVHSSKTSAR